MGSITINSEAEGLYKFEALRLDESGAEVPGSRRMLADWFPNLITNGGLEYMADGYPFQYCQVGTGSATPLNTNSALASHLATTSNLHASNSGAEASSPHYSWVRNTWRFAPGEAAGIIAEVGVGWEPEGGLFSRARILDGSGSPTTIQILDGETLDVSYEFRYYPKLADTVGTINFGGNIGGTYNWLMRPAEVATINNDGWQVPSSGPNMGLVGSYAGLYSGDAGTVTERPAGDAQLITSAVALPYSAGSLERAFTLSIPLISGNFDPPGIRSIVSKMGVGLYQFQFDPAIPKTEDDELVLTIFHKWGRRA